MHFKIPILMYHQVSTNVHPNYFKFTVTTKAFKSQLMILKKLGYNSVTPSELLSYSRGEGNLPSKPIMITFDDGYEEAVNNAVPILQDLGFNAVFYIPTDYVGEKSSWMIHDTGVEFRVINCQRVKELSSLGFELGAHSMKHPHLSNISTQECRHELEGSKNRLEQILGRNVVHMAYPFGSFNDNVKEAAEQAGYLTACTDVQKIASHDFELLTLPRLNVGMEDSLLDFVLKIHTAYSVNRVVTESKHIIKSAVPAPARRYLKKIFYNEETQ